MITGETQDPNSVGIAVDQRLTRQEALDDMTRRVRPVSSMQDNRLGQLTPGAHADLIVLDQDYFTVPNHSIRDIRSLLTIIGGKVVWGSPKGPWASLDPCYTAMGGQKWVDAVEGHGRDGHALLQGDADAGVALSQDRVGKGRGQTPGPSTARAETGRRCAAGCSRPPRRRSRRGGAAGSRARRRASACRRPRR